MEYVHFVCGTKSHAKSSLRWPAMYLLSNVLGVTPKSSLSTHHWLKKSMHFTNSFYIHERKQDNASSFTSEINISLTGELHFL